ncbi:MAG: arginine--tRNA ligase [Bacilli bacterium]|nr:arginine--tRNA ligase [Bacilli bacterium]
MSIINNLQKDLIEIIKKAGYEVDTLAFTPSNRRDLGEYQLNDAMQLTKKYHENPRIIAEKIVSELEKDKRFININIAGPGFINISLSEDYINEIANSMNSNLFTNIDKKDKKKIIIDFGGANVAKTLHVGHLRSANLGEALKRLSRLLGYEVIGDAHLGDYGRPLGLVIREIQERYPNLAYFDQNRGHYDDIELPITNKDLEEIYPIASNKSKEDESYLEEARIITTKFQNHEPGYYDLWQKIISISKEDIKKTYEDLYVTYDIWNGESDEMEYFDELYDLLVKKNLLVESEGAQVIEVAEENETSPMPPLMIIKSNGSKSYDATDLVTIYEREINHHADEMWYVVDGRQGLHFEQVFRAARKSNIIPDKVYLEHVGFGTMNGKDGKPFKTRDGGVLPLKELIKIVTDETKKRLSTDTIEEDKIDQIAHEVAIGAIKYADFLSYRETDYIFEVEKFSDLEGKTGPYLLYSTIRMKSLLNKAKDLKQDKVTKLKGLTEKNIVLLLLELPHILEKAITSKSMNDIADYIYNLTANYNKFYAENKVLTEEDEELRESWLVLTNVVYQVNIMLLDIMGIKVPEKM